MELHQFKKIISDNSELCKKPLSIIILLIETIVLCAYFFIPSNKLLKIPSDLNPIIEGIKQGNLNVNANLNVFVILSLFLIFFPIYILLNWLKLVREQKEMILWMSSLTTNSNIKVLSYQEKKLSVIDTANFPSIRIKKLYFVSVKEENSTYFVPYSPDEEQKIKSFFRNHLSNFEHNAVEQKSSVYNLNEQLLLDPNYVSQYIKTNGNETSLNDPSEFEKTFLKKAKEHFLEKKDDVLNSCLNAIVLWASGIGLSIGLYKFISIYFIIPIKPLFAKIILFFLVYPIAKVFTYIVMYFFKKSSKNKNDYPTQEAYHIALYKNIIPYWNSEFKHSFQANISVNEVLQTNIFQPKHYDISSNNLVFGNYEGCVFKYASLIMNTSDRNPDEDEDDALIFNGFYFKAYLPQLFSGEVYLIPNEDTEVDKTYNAMEYYLNVPNTHNTDLSHKIFKQYNVIGSNSSVFQKIDNKDFISILKKKTNRELSDNYIIIKGNTLTILTNNEIFDEEDFDENSTTHSSYDPLKTADIYYTLYENLQLMKSLLN